jgi:CheY-like chemotaxis protein
MNETPITVLLVDDEPSHLMLARRGLSKLPIPPKVLAASTVDEALRLISSSQLKLDIGFIDLNLGSDSGLKIVKRLRELYTSIPVIVISTSELSQEVQKCYAEGAYAFIVKTPDTEIFQDNLRRAFRFYCAAKR